MKLIETKTLASAAGSIEFTSIPQDATDLLLLVSLRTNRSLQGDGFYLRFNGSSTGYTQKRIIGDGANRSSDTGLGSLMAGAATATANVFGNARIYIPRYTQSVNKAYSNDGVAENNNTTAFMGLNAGLWSNTSNITSIAISPEGGSQFEAGSTISLYTIGPNTSNAGAKATGGTIQRVGDYFVHTFTSSGTFTPTTDLTNVEYVVVAGGGGASRGAGGVGSGGGGGGGFRSSVVGELSGGGASPEARLSLTSGVGYTVTVGAGANNSSFDTITSLAGGYTGTNGGSGGGGNQSTYGGPGSGTAGQGTNGGTATASTFSGAGGGGAGAAAASFTGQSYYGGGGGAGQITAISGVGIAYGGGGGGSGYDGGGGGGIGGGGNGGTTSGAQNGAVNTGGGGGAGRSAAADTTGGSGIVIVRYLA